MNKHLIALAATAACAAHGGAAAQSNVTLGGIADAALRYVRNSDVGSAKALVSGSNSTSRIFIRGSEDLGAGLSAGFHLEHGILLDTGSQASSTQFWDRRSTVSLVSKAWGELRLGRDFVPSYTNWSRYDPFSYVGAAGSNNLIAASQDGPIRAAFGTSPNTTVRSSNSVQWLLPSGWAGVEGGVMVAAREGGTAEAGQHKLIGARLGWANKAFGLSAAHTRSENSLTGDERFTDSAIGGSADFGGVRVAAAYRQFKLADARQKNLLLGLWVPVGPAGELKFSYGQARFDGSFDGGAIGANEARLVGLGYVHNLSKRSALYATASRIDNDGAAGFAVPGGPPIPDGGSSTGLEAGLRHSF